MIRRIMLIVITFFINTINAQQERELNVGVNGGITTGIIKNYASAAFGIEANYLFDWYEDFKLGPSVNLIYFSPKGEAGEDAKPFIYMPVGGSVIFKANTEKFYIGTDLGYAVGISPSGDRGGIFFKPQVGYQISDNLKLNIFYATVKKRQPSYEYVGLGVLFDIFASGQYGYSY